MRSVFAAAAIVVLSPFVLLSSTGVAQELPACDGHTVKSEGVVAKVSASKATGTSGQTEATLTLHLRDAKGNNLGDPKVTTALGKEGNVELGEAGQPGSLKLNFKPNAYGGASTVDVTYINAEGQNKSVSIKCGL